MSATKRLAESIAEFLHTPDITAEVLQLGQTLLTLCEKHNLVVYVERDKIILERKDE